jgi:hypothetical protein
LDTFGRRWKEFKDSVKEAADSVVNFVKETKAELKVADEIANKKERIQKLNRQLIRDEAC